MSATERGDGQADRLAVIARCEGCGYEYLVRPDRTVSLACDCPLRDPDTPWSVVEMVPAEQLRGAVEERDAAKRSEAGVRRLLGEAVTENARLKDEVARLIAAGGQSHG